MKKSERIIGLLEKMDSRLDRLENPPPKQITKVCKGEDCGHKMDFSHEAKFCPDCGENYED
jgi:hypothetical protein